MFQASLHAYLTPSSEFWPQLLYEFDPLLADIFDGLPVLFVWDWKEITPRYLRKEWEKLFQHSPKNHDLEHRSGKIILLSL